MIRIIRDLNSLEKSQNCKSLGGKGDTRSFIERTENCMKKFLICERTYILMGTN